MHLFPAVVISFAMTLNPLPLIAGENLKKLLMAEANRRCVDKDQRDKIPLATTHQGNIGWCYAHAAANLASFATGKAVSPEDIAMNYDRTLRTMPGFRRINDKGQCEQSKVDGLNEGGWANHAFNLANANGFCEQSKIRSATDPEAIWTLKERLVSLDDKISRLPPAKCLGDLPHSDQQLAFDMFPGLQNASAVLKASSTRSLADLADSVCGSRFHSDYHATSHDWDRGDPDGIRLIQDELLNGRIAAVDVDFGPLMKKKTDAMGILTDPDQSLCEKWDSYRFGEMHAVTVVGQRLNTQTGRCEMILRNSWGKDCDAYADRKMCDPKTGDLFVPIDQLVNLGAGITTLSK